MTAYSCDHGRQIKSLLKHIIREERSIYQIRVQSKPTESPTKKKNDYFFFQSWRPILHSFERKTFNVPSLITKVSNNCQTHAILSFIKRKPSITTHDAVQESYTFAFVYECFPFILIIYVLIYSNFRPFVLDKHPYQSSRQQLQREHSKARWISRIPILCIVRWLSLARE